MKLRTSLLAATLILVALGTIAAGCNRAGATYPSKPIEFVVSSAPGAGNDVLARTMADIIEKKKLMPVTLSVVNKPGGSSGVAKAYLAEKPGDPYFWLIASTSFQTSAVRGESKLSYKDFTPLAMLGEDSMLILTRPDSPYKTFTDVMDAAKKNPKKVNWAGGTLGNDDHILMYNIQKASGVEFNFVSFESGDLIGALLGGHVDLICVNPAEAAGQVAAGKVRPLASGGSGRIPSLPDIPSLKELGINASHAQYRGVVGPKDMPKDAVTYLDSLFKKVTDTEEWNKYLKDNDVTNKYGNSEAYGKFLEADFQRYDEAMTGLGLNKKK